MSPTLPRVGVIACARRLGHHPFHAVGDKYLRALTDGAGVTPLLIPALPLDPDAVLDIFDGLLLTGSSSNVEPRHYHGPDSAPGTLHDPARDAVSLPLIRAAIARGIPVFGICRGCQELNVALGGSLHQRVHEVPGLADHRADDTVALDEQYGPAHAVRPVPGGQLAGLIGNDAPFPVNSLHGQGIDRLAPGLRIEATAPDGLIEAVSLPSAAAFTLAVQWHPEWKPAENPVSTALFAAFGAAVRAGAAQPRGEAEI